MEGILLGAVLIVFLVATIGAGYWNGLALHLPFWEKLPGGNYTQISLAVLLLLIAAYVHFSVRKWTAKRVARKLLKEVEDPDLHPNFERAFKKNSRWFRTLFRRQPAGWGKRTHRRLLKVVEDTNVYIQNLNDMYTNPSGDKTFLQVMGAQTMAGKPSQEPSDEKKPASA